MKIRKETKEETQKRAATFKAGEIINSLQGISKEAVQKKALEILG